MKKLFLSLAITLALSATCTAIADTITFTPDAARGSANIDGLVPLPKLGSLTLPKGAAQFEDGTLAITIIPEWNFDRVPVLRGPIIRTDVTTNGRQGMISGVALFQEGFWFNKFAPGADAEIVATDAGSFHGRITSLAADSLTLTEPSGVQHLIPLASMKEIHSPRAFAFVIPALAAGPILPDAAWVANAPSITIQPSNANTNFVAMRRDPLLQGDGDWSNGKLIALGTVLALVNTAQFVPELVLPQFSHQLWNHANKKAFYTLTTPLPNNPAPLINGNTYSIPGIPFNATH